MSGPGEDVSRTPDGVDTAWSERERMKDAFRELLGEMPAFQAFVSGAGAKEDGEAGRPPKRRRESGPAGAGCSGETSDGATVQSE